MSLSVLIPTYRRPDSLARALRSVFAQDRAPDEVIVADNDPAGGARPVVDGLQAAAPCTLRYVHAPEPGVANARNAGFAATDAMRIAQLDDDESAVPTWLSALETVRQASNAQVVFGPVRCAPEPSRASSFAAAWCGRLYAREPNLPDGVTAHPFGCGNSLIDRSLARLPEPVFDPRANETGGEDDLLFSHLARHGAVFAWASKAEVEEHVEGRRLALAHLARRAFSFGQSPPQTAVHEGRPVSAAGWMLIGAAQLAVFAAAAGPATLLGPATGALCVDKAIQGAGKLVWFDFVSPKFYGPARLED